MSRGRRRALIALGVLVFLALSFELARWLTLEDAERSDILSLLQAEARGNADSMLSQLHGCSGACVAHVRRDARNLRRRGAVQILADSSQTAYALTSTTGFTRIAWKSSGEVLPVVQCITVSRKGNALAGLTVTLLRVSLPLHPTTADC